MGTGMTVKKASILALDLEGTLISNAMSQFPRPGLFEFLTRCQELFSRIVIFTTVSEDRFRSIADRLVQEGHAPPWFASIEYVTWNGPTKDLAFIPGARPDDAILVDDFAAYVHPGQESRWVEVEHFDYQGSTRDEGLRKLIPVLERWPSRHSV